MIFSTWSPIVNYVSALRATEHVDDVHYKHTYITTAIFSYKWLMWGRFDLPQLICKDDYSRVKKISRAKMNSYNIIALVKSLDCHIISETYASLL